MKKLITTTLLAIAIFSIGTATLSADNSPDSVKLADPGNVGGS